MSEKYRSSTWRLIICWFVSLFVFYGIMLLLPTILQSLFSSTGSYNFKYLFIFMVTAVEFCCYNIWQFLMDHPRIGRKKSVYYGVLSSFILFIFVILMGSSYPLLLLLVFLLVKFGISLMFLVISSFYLGTLSLYDWNWWYPSPCKSNGNMLFIRTTRCNSHGFNWSACY
jgi:MFS family permease